MPPLFCLERAPLPLRREPVGAARAARPCAPTYAGLHEKSPFAPCGRVIVYALPPIVIVIFISCTTDKYMGEMCSPAFSDRDGSQSD